MLLQKRRTLVHRFQIGKLYQLLSQQILHLIFRAVQLFHFVAQDGAPAAVGGMPTQVSFVRNGVPDPLFFQRMQIAFYRLEFNFLFQQGLLIAGGAIGQQLGAALPHGKRNAFRYAHVAQGLQQLVVHSFCPVVIVAGCVALVVVVKDAFAIAARCTGDGFPAMAF